MKKTRIIVNCSNCGTELERRPFEIKINHNHFCNLKCRTEWCKKNWQGENSPAYRGGPIQVSCAWCDGSIEVLPSKAKSQKRHFCSGSCKVKWHDSEKNPNWKRTEVKCIQCSKSLRRSPSELKNRPKPFCDRKCFSDWRRENWQDGKAPQWKGQPGMIEVQCESCGNTIRRYRDRIENQEKQFCNRKCYAVWQSQNQSGENHHMWNGGKVKVNCAECGEELERIRYEVESRSEKFFCNPKCMGKWQSKNKAGPSHPMWRGGWLPYYGPNWKHQRQAARKRDHYKCRHCGMTNGEHKETFGYVLHVHHRTAFREFGYIVGENENYRQANSLKNLITLCVICHRKVEFGKIQLAVDHN